MPTFKERIEADTPVLVDFFAEWCGPCKMMKPILEEVKASHGDALSILQVDIDKNPQAARAYRVQAVPTLLLFRKGKVLWRHSGVVSANQLKEVIRQYA